MKRGKPLQRRTPLRRKTRLRARSKTNSYRRRERDLEYMKLVRRLPCMVRSWNEVLANRLEPNPREVLLTFGDLLAIPSPTSCEGRVQADHAGARGLGVKAPDDTCTPLCMKHHRERTEYKGTFHWFAALEMRAWNDWAIDRTRTQIAELRHGIDVINAEVST